MLGLGARLEAERSDDQSPRRAARTQGTNVASRLRHMKDTLTVEASQPGQTTQRGHLSVGLKSSSKHVGAPSPPIGNLGGCLFVNRVGLRRHDSDDRGLSTQVVDESSPMG